MMTTIVLKFIKQVIMIIVIMVIIMIIMIHVTFMTCMNIVVTAMIMIFMGARLLLICFFFDCVDWFAYFVY